MSEFTEIIEAIEAGDALAANRLFPLVYDELRKLTAAHLANEQPGQTLQPTALVHEAYLRLSEATSVTNVRGTVIRLFPPKGHWSWKWTTRTSASPLMARKWSSPVLGPRNPAEARSIQSAGQ